MLYFTDIVPGRKEAASAACIAHVRPYGELAADLQNDTAAAYNFIVPNKCHDTHDCGVDAGDAWLSAEVPRILNSRAYREDGALFITWDEGSPDDGPIGMIVLSPYAKGNGYTNSVHYTHASLLRTLQEIFGVGPWLGDAASAADLGDLFAVALSALAPVSSTSAAHTSPAGAGR